MRQTELAIDMETLKRLEERLKRGIPKWEQGHFLEFVVPQLVEKLQRYERLNADS